MSRLGLAAALPLISLIACARAPEGERIPTDTTTFGVATPSAEELARFEAAAELSERHGGRTLLIVRGTDVIYERSRAEVDPEVSTQLYSGTKLFSCGLAGVGLREGWLDLDAPIVADLPDFSGDPAVTARHLLTFTSGVQDDRRSLTTDAFSGRDRVDDRAAAALALPQQTPPGEVFTYAAVHLWLFSALIEAKTGAPALQLLERDLLGPIGMRHGGWMTDAAGHTALPYGAYTTAREWAKYGVLLRDDGVWQGERLLPEGHVDLCRTGTVANPAYGLATWLDADPGEADLRPIRIPTDGPLFSGVGHADWLIGAGAKDQRLYVMPSEGLVVVRLGDGGGGFSDRELVGAILGE